MLGKQKHRLSDIFHYIRETVVNIVLCLQSDVILSIRITSDPGRWEVPMLKFIENTLLCFHPCFSRKASFGWFVTIIAGSIIRDIALYPRATTVWNISSMQTPGRERKSLQHGS